MKRIINFFFVFASLICSVFAKDIYVSSSTGNDSNNGSISAPLKTIAAAPKENVNIFLKRGDIFFETIRKFKNAKIDAYGDGEKPLLCGLKILKNKNAWKKLPNDIWELDLTKTEDFVGYLSIEKKSLSAQNNIGGIYDIENDKLYGNLVKNFDDIKSFGDFLATDGNPRPNGIPKDDTFTKLYFKMKDNPSKLIGNLGLITYSFGIRENRNCEFQNIAIKGFGGHGICKAWDCKFRNIDIDLIGGSLLRSYKRYVRFGNGVEFWTGNPTCNNNLVENCFISRTYDCGATIQGHIGKGVKPTNIKFINNRFLRCRQGFEHWTEPRKGDHTTFENCEVSNNKFFDCGVCDFGVKGKNNTTFLSYERNSMSGLVIKNNISWGAPVYYTSKGHFAKLENNTFYVFSDSYLYDQPLPKKGNHEILARNADDIAKLKEKLTNYSDNIVLVNRNDKKMREKIIEKYFADMKERIKIFDKE